MVSSPSPPSVLLVEDDAVIADMYTLQLTRDGFEVELARDGVQAIERLQQAPADVVLLDIQMPRVDGWGVLEALSGRGLGSQKVIMMSSFSDPAMIAKAIGMGAVEWLVKSQTTPAELSRRLAFWLKARERQAVPGAEGFEEDFEGITDPSGRPFSESPVPMLIADDYATYVAANQAALDLLACSREEVIGKRVWDFTPGGSVGTGLELWRRFLALGESRGRYQLVRPDGTLVEADYHALVEIRPGRHLSSLTPVKVQDGGRR